MSQLLSAAFLLCMGGGVLVVAWRGYNEGSVPAGANFFKGRWMPNRRDNWLAFHFFLTLYYCSGLALTVWGLLTLVGMAPPLPLN